MTKMRALNAPPFGHGECEQSEALREMGFYFEKIENKKTTAFSKYYEL